MTETDADLPENWRDLDGIRSYEDAIAELRRRHISADPVRVILCGEPVAWARHMGGRSTRPFTPAKQRDNAAAWRIAAQQAMGGREPFDGPVACTMVATFAIPKSLSKKQMQAALRGELLPAKRPDLSNILKQFEDSCNTVIFRDDALICDWRVRKEYGPIPQIEVIVRPIQ